MSQGMGFCITRWNFKVTILDVRLEVAGYHRGKLRAVSISRREIEHSKERN